MYIYIANGVCARARAVYLCMCIYETFSLDMESTRARFSVIGKRAKHERTMSFLPGYYIANGVT